MLVKLLQSRATTSHALIMATRSEVHDGWASMVRRIYGVAYTQEVVVAISKAPKDASDRPRTPIVIKKVEILEVK